MKSPAIALLLAVVVLTALQPACAQDQDLAGRFVCVYNDSATAPVPEGVTYSWEGSPLTVTIREVPFYLYPWLGYCSCFSGQLGLQACRISGFVDDITGVFSRLHVLSSLAKAADIPDGYVAAQLVVTYGDGDESILDLVAGVNTADTNYNWPENQLCLGHTQVEPALSAKLPDGTIYALVFYASLDLKAKPIESIGVRMPSTACESRRGCDGEETSELQVMIDGMTFER